MMHMNEIESMLDRYLGHDTNYMDPASTYGEIPDDLPSGVAVFNTHDGLNFLLSLWKNKMLEAGFLRTVDKEAPPDDLPLPHSSLHYDIAKWGYLVVQEAANRRLTRGHHVAATDSVGDSSNGFFLGTKDKPHCIIRTFSEGSIIKIALFEWQHAQNNHVEGIPIHTILENPNCVTWRIPVSD